MDEAAHGSLLAWIQRFHDKVDSDVRVLSLADLCDGVFLAHIMHHIDPEYVNLESINHNADGNWALKSSNLKTLLRAIELFYHEEVGQVCDASELINSSVMAKENDVHEAAKLAELILGCAVQCRNRSEYIHEIMQMDPSEQANMMHLIENLMQRFQPSSPSPRRSSLTNNSFAYLTHGNESSEDIHLQLTHAQEKASAAELRLLDAEREKRELAEKLENSLNENRDMASKYTALEEERDKLLNERQSTLTRDNKKIQQIVEGELHALTLQLEEKNEELQRVKRESNERLMVLEHEVRRQADELDISRSKIAQLGKLESSVAKYKKKLEEMNSLRTQVKDLEAHNAQYLDKVLDLESTIKTMPTLKAMVEKYKNQVVDLETANVEAISNNQIKDQKIRRLQEELDSALGGKEFLENQVEELRNQLAMMQNHQGQMDDSMNTSAASLVGTSADFLLGRESVSGLREKVARLERELTELRSGTENAQETHLQSELELALKAKESLQVSVFQLKKQQEQLMEELETLRNASTPATGSQSVQPPVHAVHGSPTKSSTSMASSAHVTELEAKVDQLNGESDSMRATVQELTNRLKEKESVINELSEQRAKLENYTKKTLHAVQTKYMVAVSSHRNQLNEKQEKVGFLEKKMKEMRASYSREQALMMSSFYEIGGEMQRRTMMPQSENRASGGHQPSAWLANKRSEERAKRRNF
ncbi:TPA: hypothetical protein N0F65_012813 [Lagenidium giganteum]|uniref:Calponin-homology (CH) domain-containing protein n=1 Tax=Lagenidium giganteum TaxID=4803 RepID=A0AAV2YEY8_9STRA|nr:TPA: hypothetical protein N0F65_012813 [Lagenidium giganteum]